MNQKGVGWLLAYTPSVLLAYVVANYRGSAAGVMYVNFRPVRIFLTANNIRRCNVIRFTMATEKNRSRRCATQCVRDTPNAERRFSRSSTISSLTLLYEKSLAHETVA